MIIGIPVRLNIHGRIACQKFGLVQQVSAERMCRNYSMPVMFKHVATAHGEHGFKANFAVTSAPSARNRKILESKLMSRYCSTCSRFKDSDPPDHECDLNHEGSASSTELQ